MNHPACDLAERPEARTTRTCTLASRTAEARPSRRRIPVKQHPFQRKSNRKKTVVTPFQRALVQCIEEYSGGEDMMSGRQLSALLGKSANHISQMLNDGFVPAGPTILEMSEVLELDQSRTDMLIRAAMETKATQRSRDHFWITETQRMLDDRDDELARLFAFLAKEGLEDKYRRYASRRTSTGKKRSKKATRKKR